LTSFKGMPISANAGGFFGFQVLRHVEKGPVSVSFYGMALNQAENSELFNNDNADNIEPSMP
jgi:hypothetical protein